MGFWDFLPGIGDDKPKKAAPKPAASKPAYTADDLRVKNWLGPESPRKSGTGYVKSAEEMLIPKAYQAKQPTAAAPKPFNMSPGVSSAMAKAGWTVPTAAAPDPSMALLETELDSANARELARFSYGVEEGEAARILDAYGAQNPGKTLDPKKLRVESAPAKAVPLTQDAYDKLTAEQRGAVDFNTVMVDAREKDLMLSQSGDSATKEELRSYNERAERIFGKGGGSQAYAPNTLRLLEEIDFKAVGQDLDEFLSLERTVGTDQLKGWTGAGGAAQRKDAGGYADANEYGSIRSAENQAKVTADAIAKAGELIEKTLAGARVGGGVRDFLSVRSGQEAPIGWNADAVLRADPLAQKKEEVFRGAFGMLVDPTTANMDTFWGGMEQLGYDEAQIDEVFSYVDARTRDLARSGRQTGGRSAQEIRALAGLEAL